MKFCNNFFQQTSNYGKLKRKYSSAPSDSRKKFIKQQKMSQKILSEILNNLYDYLDKYDHLSKNPKCFQLIVYEPLFFPYQTMLNIILGTRYYKIMDSVPCLICQMGILRRIDLIKEHYLVCSEAQNKVIQVKRTRLMYAAKSICLRCGDSFESQSTWDHHSKSQECKKLRPNLASQPSLNSSATRSMLSGSFTTSSGSTERKLGIITQQYVQINCKDWFNLNKGANQRILAAYFTSHLPETLNEIFTHKINLITKEDIKKLKIKKLYDIPIEDLLIPTKVDQLIKKLTPSNSLKFIKFLNKKSRQYRLFPIRPQPIVQREQRQINPVKILDLIKFFFALFSTDKVNLLHIALDLLIIFQTGVRFKSDYENLKHQLRTSPRNIKLKVNKTSQVAHIVLPEQTYKLMQILQWQGWHRKTLNLFKYMKSWSGFFGYSMKYTLIAFLYFLAPPTNIDVKLQTGHRYLTNMKPYLLAVQININRVNIAKTEIPGILDSENTWAQLQQYNQKFFPGNNFGYCNVNSNFMSSLILLVYGSKQKYENDKIIKIKLRQSAEEVLSIPFPEQQQPINSEIQEADSPSEQILDLQDPAEEFTVFGQVATGNFETSMYETRSGEQYCKFCNQVYVSPLCKCLVFRKIQVLPIEKGVMPIDIPLKLPNEYFGKESNPDYLRIRRLIALRRFSFCQQSTCTFGSFSFQLQQSLLSWQSEQFKRFRTEVYFPPLRLISSGGMYLKTQSSFGLAATEFIPKNTLIGEYAADIVDSTYLHNCRRLDTMMILDEAKNINICPIINMGLVCLLNSSCNEKQRNCQSLKLEINGSIKIIVYTIKDIDINSELLYDYGDFFKEDFSKFVSTDEKPLIYEQTPMKKPVSLKKNQIKTQKKKRLNKIVIEEMRINQCFADVIYYICSQVYEQLPEQISNRPLMIKDFLNINKEKSFSQQDALQFFSFVNDRLGKKSVFNGTQINQSQQCLSCMRVNEKSVSVLFFQMGQGKKFAIKQDCLVDDYACSSCPRKTVCQSVHTIKKIQTYLVCAYPRRDQFGQIIKYIAHCPSNFQFMEMDYVLEYLILFYGQENAGHYIVSDRKQNKLVGATEEPKDIFLEERSRVYLSFYRKK